MAEFSDFEGDRDVMTQKNSQYLLPFHIQKHVS